MVANFRKIKGISFFIQAASIIPLIIKNTKFIVIGKDLNQSGYTMKDLERLANELQVIDQIIFLGERDDVYKLMKIVDVGVLPSLSEGVPNMILKFMACSKPVMATDVGGNREAIGYGERAFWVAPKNSDELAEAIQRLL